MHRPIKRRTLLKASGIAIGLPLLESMSPAIAGDPPSPQRMVLICNTLGLHPPSLFPKTSGREYETTEYLKLLEQHRERLTLFSGLSHPDQSGKQPHDTELTWLTSARNPGLGGFKNSISIDQYAAHSLGYVTRFPSISMSTHTRKSQSYTRNGVMIPADDKPSTLFSKLFLTGSPNEVRAKRQSLADGRSILDSVADQAKSIRSTSSVDDRRQLDEYFASIRAAEAELAEVDAWLDRPKPNVDVEAPRDVLDSADLIGRTRALLQLIPLILRTDSSRIISVVIQDHGNVPKIQGVSVEHHNLSHHGQDPKKIQQLKIIEKQILECYADLLTELSTVSESGDSLLDRTSVLFGSNLGNANAHDPSNLPILLAGGGYEHGSYVAHDASRNTPLCNLFVNLLNHLGIETNKFGTSTGTLTF